MNFPELRFDNANNASLSLSVLGEFARLGKLRVISHDVDSTGKLILRIELPGSQARRPSTSRR